MNSQHISSENEQPANDSTRFPGKTEKFVPLALAIFSFFIFAFISQAIISRKILLTGDEPHYLLIAHSLWKDGDLDLANNYINEDYKRYTPEHLEPHRDFGSADGKIYSFHNPGLPVLILPFYILCGRNCCLLFLNILTAVLIYKIFQLSRKATHHFVNSILITLTFIFTGPILVYSSLIYPEVPGALLFIIAFDRLVFRDPRKPGTAVILGLIVSVFPWLHFRLAMMSFIIAVIYLLTCRSVKFYALFLIIPVLSAVLFCIHQTQLFGHPLHALIYADSSSLTPAALKGVFGILLDRAFGFPAVAPHLLLMLLGIPLLFKGKKKMGIIWTAMIVPYFFITSTRPIWWAGWCPPARYLAPALPLLALPFVRLLDHKYRKRTLFLFIPLFLAGMAENILWMDNPYRLFSRANGINRMFQSVPSLQILNYLLPGYSIVKPSTYWTTALAAALGCWAAFFIYGRSLVKEKLNTQNAGRLVRTTYIILSLLIAVSAFGSLAAVRHEFQQDKLAASYGPPKESPVVFSPQKNQILGSDPIYFRWAEVKGADGYRLTFVFPDGQTASYDEFSALELKIDKKLWKTLPEGDYKLKIHAMYKNRLGPASDWIEFSIYRENFSD